MQAILRPQRSGGVAALRLHRGESEQSVIGSGSRRRRAAMLPLFDLPELAAEEEVMTLIMALVTAGAFL